MDALPMATDDLEWAIPRIRCDLHERSHSSHDCGVPPFHGNDFPIPAYNPGSGAVHSLCYNSI